MNKKYSLCERFFIWCRAAAYNNRLPLISSLIFGFLAHMFAFSNKLLNADEISALFSKGATVTSGRWGLEAVKILFPDVSVPWLYGVVSILLLSLSMCLIVRIFNVRSKLLQLLLSGIVMSFPALVGNFCFMFTSAAYALAIFLTVLSVYLFIKKGWLNRLASAAFLAFSLGIYQAYISIAASFFVLLLIQRLMDRDSSAAEVLKEGLRYFLMLLASLALYYAITFIVDYFGSGTYQNYEVTASGNILESILLAYSSFAHTFTDGYFGYVNSKLSLAAHIVCALAAAAGFIKFSLCGQNWRKILLSLVLLLIFPLSVNCIYLIASTDIIHSLVLLSFISVYIFAVISADRFDGKLLAGRDVTALALFLIIAGNVFFANKVYLKMYLQYENAYAFYNTLMAEVMDTPGFNRDTVIDIVGNSAGGIKTFYEIDTSKLAGPNKELVNIYTRIDFIKYYLGLDLYAYTEDLMFIDWYDDVPCYPDEGSIIMQEDQNRIIVKFGG
ncbi:MAG: glucosyltransferase domain-containing protein [Candidatus Limivicinus sp.]|jgi:hypothetical protein